MLQTSPIITVITNKRQHLIRKENVSGRRDCEIR